MVRFAIVAMTLLVAALMAGCGGKDEDKTPPVDATKAGVQPTESTGIIIGVVVDSTVTPIAGASVRLDGNNQQKETTTDEHGIFGFEGLPAGDYFLFVEAPGYNPVQANAHVEVGIDDPPAVRVALQRDEARRPYAETLTFDGFIQCSVRAVVNAFAVCSSLPAGSEDNFATTYDLTRQPTFIQSEMVWESTQALGDRLKLEYTDFTLDAFVNYAIAIGPSPLLLQADTELIANHTLGPDHPLDIRVFTDSADGTVLIPGFDGVGLVVNQKFTIFTTFFYNFTPEEGYMFIEDGAPKIPA